MERQFYRIQKKALHISFFRKLEKNCSECQYNNFYKKEKQRKLKKFKKKVILMMILKSQNLNLSN